MDAAVDKMVRDRALNRCEYCHMPQPFYSERFQIDHVVARQHSGTSEAINLALACIDCNLHKGPNISSVDPVTGTRVDLFNPRSDIWVEHFEWAGVQLVGRTAMGRATIRLLQINSPRRSVVRETLMEEGVFPLDDR
ncbi:HNH endonuclease [Humisphaera borealis]|uniref:HNH endonuclease n=2 Tax=Humisphaera borealis TaxID=2807512 RepID=A0A7M2X4F9_9BACT|nr:HNH endonuclease [Humisphaera borealis]